MINDILDFSKIEPRPWSRCRSACATGSMRTTSPALRADQKGLELADKMLPEAPDMPVGDAGRLRQILVKLVGKTIKLIPRGRGGRGGRDRFADSGRPLRAL